MSDYREKAIEDYGEECMACGTDDRIVVHHKNGDQGDNRLSNLIPLCEECHGEVHGRSDKHADLVRELGYKPRSDERTCIQVRSILADELHERKDRGDSYEDVIWRLIDQANK